MKFEYKTIFADSSDGFNEKLNKYGRQGFKLDKFEYREYTQRVKDEGSVVIQAYVGVMVRNIDDEKPLSKSED